MFKVGDKVKVKNANGLACVYKIGDRAICIGGYLFQMYDGVNQIDFSGRNFEKIGITNPNSDIILKD